MIVAPVNTLAINGISSQNINNFYQCREEGYV